MTAHLLDPDAPGVAAAWAALRAASAAPSPHAALPFVQAVAKESGARVRVLAVTPETAPEAARFEAGLLVCEKRRGPWRCAVQPPLGFYHGPILARPLAARDVEARRSPLDVLASALTAHFDAAALILPPGPGDALPDARTFTWAGFTCEVRYAYRLPAGAPADVRARMRPSARQRLGAAPAALVATTPEDVAAQVTASYARHGRKPPLSASALARIVEATVQAGAGQAWGAAGAAALMLTHRGYSFEALSGSPPGDAHTRLVWALAAALGAGAEAMLDLGGANTPSIAAHKRGLGAQLVPFVRATWHRAGAPRLVAAVRPLV